MTKSTDRDGEPLAVRAARLPREPGVYIFKGRFGRILYIGKAKDLRARVQTYFNEGGDGRPLVPHLTAEATDLDFVVTPNEFEALLLENNMIKKERPKYNIRLRDDKSYVSLRYDPREPFSRIEVTRRVKRDGAKYLGPFLSAGSVRATLRLILPHYPLRLCTDHVFNNRVRPCVYYQIGRCPAPCVDKITPEAYRENLEGAVRLLKGQEQDLIKLLEERMWAASEAQNFEVAAKIRDQLDGVRRTVENARVISSGHRDCDAIVIAREGVRSVVQVLVVRDGRLMTARAYPFTSPQEDDELLADFLVQFYGAARSIPDEVLLATPVEDPDSLEDWLRDQRGKGVRIRVPERGEGAKLIAMAERNAAAALERPGATERATAALTALRDALGLDHDPDRMECYDISHTGGDETVGVVVTFERGEKDKGGYRKFRVRTDTGGDDYLAMEEVLRRRFSRLLREDGVLPDLVVIDGGRGQLNRALAVMKEVGVDPHECTVIGLAKGRTEDGVRVARTARQEKIYLGTRDVPVLLGGDDPALALLDRIRDEAHRFAITYHRSLRSKRRITSALDEVAGVGPRIRRKILSTFGSVDALKGVTADEIAQRADVPHRVAAAVAERFGSA